MDLKTTISRHRIRIVLGFLVLIMEMYLFLGTGVMGEDAVNFLSGEGSWEEAIEGDDTEFRQVFRPQHKKLQMISFLMHKEHITSEGGEVCVSIQDEDGETVFRNNLALSDVKNGRFTDVDVNVVLSTYEEYSLILTATAADDGAYPRVGVCSTDYELSENKKLVQGGEMPGVQLVSRYAYADVLNASNLCRVLIICLVTALGIMFGLPQNRKLRRAVAYLLMLVVPYILGQRLELLSHKEMFYLPMAMKWNLGIMYALEILVLLITHSPGFSVVLTNIVLTILYSVNYFTIMYRGTALRLNDFTAIRTAAGVVDSYSFKPNSHMAIAWGLLGMFAVFGIASMSANLWRKRPKVVWATVVSYAITITLAVVMAVCGGRKLLCTDYLNDIGFADKDYSGFSYELIYSCNGFLVGSCVDIKNSRIVAPDGYSVEGVEEILERFKDVQHPAEDLPHVILVMNESLADLQAVADVEISQDDMPFIRSLEDNTIKGFTNVSTSGGGTANSEFEVFTGCSMGFLPTNYYPYQQTLRRPSDSMVSQMEVNGYKTIAMHPESGNNWNRNIVYKNLDFDQILFEEEFKGAEKIHYGVSDAATYDKVIELYEKREEGEKLFIFDLTVQNHGGYNTSGEADEVVASKLADPEIDEYLSLVKISDAAFEELIRYFENQDEKVIICMFGDHQPWIFEDVIEKYPYAGADLTQQTMDKYRTPYVIWANYDIEEKNAYDISLNYLGGMVMDIAGVPRSPYFAYLEELREEYPILTINGYVGKDGKYYNWSGNGDEFREYRMLQYNYLFDDNCVEWGY